MTDQEREARDQETHDAVIEMRAVLMGIGDSGGLIKDVSEVSLAVKEMKLRCGREEINVANLLKDMVDVKPKVEDLDKTVSNLSQFCQNNRKIIIWMGSIIGIIALSVLGVFLRHLGLG